MFLYHLPNYISVLITIIYHNLYLSTGNAVTTVKSNDPIKVMTVRTTAFEAAAEGGASVAPENSM